RIPGTGKFGRPGNGRPYKAFTVLRVRTWHYEPRAFVQPEHRVHILNRLAGSSFDQVVESHKHNNRITLRCPSNIDKVSILDPIDVRRTVDQPDKEFLVVKVM